MPAGVGSSEVKGPWEPSTPLLGPGREEGHPISLQAASCSSLGLRHGASCLPLARHALAAQAWTGKGEEGQQSEEAEAFWRRRALVVT